MHSARLAVFTASLSTFLTSLVFADTHLDELLEMPLSSLSDTKVVSATRTSLSLADIPAAVHVITAKEIQRSGARSVADVLVLAPGLHVAKHANYMWAVSARTTNEALSDSMLVMVDGRSVFNGMFSGVDWDLIPVSLNSIERIEVVLGPVGAIWGGNAANAVVNIITYDAEDAPRRRVSASAGNYHYQEYQVHHGGQVSENLFMSGYAEFVQHMPWTSDDPLFDKQQHYRVYTERFGLRGDHQNLDQTISFQVGGTRSREDYLWVTYQPDFLKPSPDAPDYAEFETEYLAEEYFAGVKFLQELSADTQWEQQLWLTYNNSDSTDRNAYYTRFDSETNYRNSDVLGGQLMLGLNYRLIDEYFRPSSQREQYNQPYLRIAEEPDFTNQSAALYFNYTYPITDTTQLMLGNRWQYFNVVEDVFAQPQVRMMQELGSNQRIWAGWGRSVISPTRDGRSIGFQENYYRPAGCKPNDPPECAYDYMWVGIYEGNDSLPVPEVDTVELGYRYWREESLQLDVNLFFSEESNIRASKFLGLTRYPVSDGALPDPSFTIMDVARYEMIAPLKSKTHGGEVSVKWKPFDTLQINANYSYKKIKAGCVGSVCGSSDGPIRYYENEPLHMATAQIMWDVVPEFWFSSVVNYVGTSEPAPSLGNEEAYTWPEVVTWDLIAGWKPTKRSPEFVLTVENLFNDQVNEFRPVDQGRDHGTQYWLEVDWQWH